MKNHKALVLEWGRLAEERHRQIASGEDISFDHVIVPTIWDLFENADPAIVVDIGCGTGDFTLRLAQVAGKVIAIEPSSASIAVAQRTCQTVSNVRFLEAPLEEVELGIDQGRVTAAVAVMTLMTTPDIRNFARALRNILPNNCCFVAIFTHPWFWPKYREYQEESWFRYEVETFIEAPFSISRRETDFVTTHIHRPLEQYLSVFMQEGFRIDKLAEPIPSVEVQALYPTPWRFPRFLGLRFMTFA